MPAFPGIFRAGRRQRAQNSEESTAPAAGGPIIFEAGFLPQSLECQGAQKPAVAHERRCVEAVADRPFGRTQLSQVFSRSPPRVLLVPSHNRQGHRHYHAVAWLLAATTACATNSLRGAGLA